MARTPQTWIIGDTHFCHKKTEEFRPFGTVENHDRELVERWNSVVHPEDLVWHVGDVFLGEYTGHTVLDKLNGRKKLVMGNHDHKYTDIYMLYFEKLHGAVSMGKTIITHIPIHESCMEYRFEINIHGHVHSGRTIDDRYRNVCAEHIDYTPVLLRNVLRTPDKTQWRNNA